MSIDEIKKITLPKCVSVYHFHVEDFCTYYVSYAAILVHNISQKGKSFRGGKKNQRDKWYGKNDKHFQKWWEREGKKHWGMDIEDGKMIQEVYDEWVALGKPNVDGGKWKK